MKKLYLFTLLVSMLAAFAAPAAFAGNAKVAVCHIPPGNPDNFHTITISIKAYTAHLAHGDIAGACNDVCATLCNDGNACTIDDTGDCEQNGCPATPVAVDCDDSDACTTDTCDPSNGCENTLRTPESCGDEQCDDQDLDECGLPECVCTPSDLCHVNMCNPETEGCAETEVMCGEGEACNLENGECVAQLPECILWTQAGLESIVAKEHECIIDTAACDLDNPITGCSAALTSDDGDYANLTYANPSIPYPSYGIGNNIIDGLLGQDLGQIDFENCYNILALVCGP